MIQRGVRVFQQKDMLSCFFSLDRAFRHQRALQSRRRALVMSQHCIKANGYLFNAKAHPSQEKKAALCMLCRKIDDRFALKIEEANQSMQADR